MRGLCRDDRLDAIAGTPDVMLSTPATVPATAPGPYASLIIYAAVEFADSADAYTVIALLSAPASSRLSVGAAPNNTLRCRADMPDGSINIVATAGAAHVGVNVVCAQLSAGLTALQCFATSGQASAVQAVDPGAGWADGLTFQENDGEPGVWIGHTACAYWAEHNAWQRAMIMQKLSLDLGISAGGGS